MAAILSEWWSMPTTVGTSLHSYMLRINIILTHKHLRVHSSANSGNDYKGRLKYKTKCGWHVYYWVFRDNYTVATEEKRCYSYEKEPILSDI